AIALLSLFHNEPILASGCPAPSFTVSSTNNAGWGAWSMALGDFNGDGKLDLAVATDSIWVFLCKGDGTFQRAGVYGGKAFSVVAGDFNGDGKLDLVVANQHANSVSILLGNGDGTFKSAVNYGAGTIPVDVAVGDFNADGKPDLAVASFGSWDRISATYTNSGVSVLLGK